MECGVSAGSAAGSGVGGRRGSGDTLSCADLLPQRAAALSPQEQNALCLATPLDHSVPQITTDSLP